MEDTLDISESTEIKVTAKVRSLMRSIGTWCGLTAILGFILSLGGFVFFALLYIDFTKYRSHLRDDEIVVLIILSTTILIMILFSKFLWDYRTNFKRSIRKDSEILLEKAVRGLRNAIIMVSVVWILGSAFMFFAFGMFIYWSNYRY